MRTAILTALCLAVITVSPYITEDGVIVVTGSNFTEAIAEFDYALVYFYVAWRLPSKYDVQRYTAVAQQLAKTNPEIKLCKVNFGIEKEIANQFQIDSPAYMFFTKGISTPIPSYPYQGDRSPAEIVNWLRKKAGIVSLEVTSVETAEMLISDNEVLAFFFGPAGEAFTNYLSAANTFEDLAFAHSNEQPVKDRFEITGENILILFKKLDQVKNIYTGSFEQHTIRDFLNSNIFPTILPFDQKVAKQTFGYGQQGFEVLLLITDNSELGRAAEQTLRDASTDLKDKIILSIAKVGESLSDKINIFVDRISISNNKIPAFRLVQNIGSYKTRNYVLEGEITAEDLKAFVSDYKEGKLKPYVQSEPIPENPYEDCVRVVVGNNFEEIVLDENTDVLMAYYHAHMWKYLAPIYSSLAWELKDVSGLVIGKMNISANEAEGLERLPSIKFYPKGKNKRPIEYEGEKTVEGFIAYLKKQSKALRGESVLEKLYSYILSIF